MPRLLPTLTATRLQATSYLLGIALFSIAFLVFLNSSISFVVTDVIGRTTAVGNAVGTLGFADELLALVACPLWGLLSDRIGVRAVAVMGYCIVGLSLVALVQSRTVFPDLLVGRLGFSLGGAACSTMVTAALPAMVAKRREVDLGGGYGGGDDGREVEEEDRPVRDRSRGHCATPSVSSELTITPTRFTSRSRSRRASAMGEDQLKGGKSEDSAGTSQLAGFVGMFTGLGALLALAVFLPLPARFQEDGQSPAQSVRTSFYTVGAVAICVAIFISIGLRGLPGEEGKSLSALFKPSHNTTQTSSDKAVQTTPPYTSLLSDSFKLAITDSRIGLGYLGGFVARASSVGISLFIPLFVNAYFIRTGLCTSAPGENLPDIKTHCRDAYKLAAALTGISQTAALICAPLFGFLGGKVAHGRSEWPLLTSALVGVAGNICFGFLKNPDAFHGDSGPWALLAVILMGISQIGAIVRSLALLSRGINNHSDHPTSDLARPRTADTLTATPAPEIGNQETAPLLSSSTATTNTNRQDRSHLKGSIAGFYSLAGGAGILLLTKLGGVLFDRASEGAPFFMLAGFNAMLGVAVIGVGVRGFLKRRGADGVGVA
ncbi:hypothetical protein MBLNU230_g2620t1 [Neophaeotheca triangularis]